MQEIVISRDRDEWLVNIAGDWYVAEQARTKDAAEAFGCVEQLLAQGHEISKYALEIWENLKSAAHPSEKA